MDESSSGRLKVAPPSPASPPATPTSGIRPAILPPPKHLLDRAFAVSTYAEAEHMSLRQAAEALYPEADERYWELLAEATAKVYPAS